jgi:multiple sugar transport system permease protein
MSRTATFTGPSVYWFNDWHRLRKLLFKALAYVVLIALCLVVVLPLGWMITAALKPSQGVPIFTVPPEWYPTKYWHWENFVNVWKDTRQPFGTYAWNTIRIVFWNILGTLLSCSLVGFGFARLRFRGRNLLFNIIILTMLIPWQVLMIPQFLMFNKLGWYGTYLPLIVPSFAGNAFFIFLIRQYMRSIPRDLDDAARIDGCSYLGVYWRIILPLSRPVLIVCAIFVFQGVWGDLLGPLLYLDANRKFTLAIGLANMVTRGDTDWNMVMAANLITIVPLLLVYFFAQEKLIGGIASVGLKG